MNVQCPHCLKYSFVDFAQTRLCEDKEGKWAIVHYICPACGRLVCRLESGYTSIMQTSWHHPKQSFMVWPAGSGRPPCPADVPETIAADYREACVVLPFSPKASAALSRRCLQNLLRSAAKVKPQDLAKEIQEVLDRRTLPTHIAENIDAIRNVGNFAAHPIKATASGQIAEVEPHEAEWNLEVLESLFDFYYVQPARAKAKRDALNTKLQSAGKPPLKS